MHRLKRAAVVLAVGESAILMFHASAVAQTSPDATAAGSPAPEKEQGSGAAVAGRASAQTKAPDGPTGGYTWRTKPTPRRAHQPRQKIDPSRPQAKGPEFTVATDGTSHISVQLSQKVEVSTTVSANTCIYELPNAQVAVPNDRNPLVTTHFSTSVRRIKLVPRGRNAQLIVELREATVPHVQVRQLPTGGAVLEVSLAKPAATAPQDAEHRRTSSHRARTRR